MNTFELKKEYLKDLHGRGKITDEVYLSETEQLADAAEKLESKNLNDEVLERADEKISKMKDELVILSKEEQEEILIYAKFELEQSKERNRKLEENKKIKFLTDCDSLCKN